MQRKSAIFWQIFVLISILNSVVHSGPPKQIREDNSLLRQPAWNQLLSHVTSSTDISSERDYVPYIVQPLPLDRLFSLVRSTHQYADEIQLHQMTVKNWAMEPPPITLFPSKFPRKQFDQAKTLQPALNLLYFRASSNYEFLEESLGEVAESDKMVRGMLDIIRDVIREDGYKRQPISVNWMRADYMLNTKDKDKENDSMEDEYELKQIEVNAAAAGGSAQAHRMTRVHRRVLSQLGLDASMEVLRDNNPFKMQIEATHLAWLKFGNPEAVLVLITSRYKDMHGMKHLPDFELGIERISGGQMQIVSMSLEEIDERLTLDPDFSLRLDDGRLVAVVSCRLSPSSPRNSKKQNNEPILRAMRKIEFSTAIKAPTIGFHLMNLKKMQQVLAKPAVVEKFFPDLEEAHYIEAIRQSFAGLWGMDADDEGTKAAVQDAFAHPERYVLKPMKESGGNNYFGINIPRKLRAMTPAERKTYILQQRVRPPEFHNFAILSNYDRPLFGKMVSELSIYGALVGDVHDKVVLYNKGEGYMVRTKWAHSDEGGILIGQGFYDAPYLY